MTTAMAETVAACHPLVQFLLAFIAVLACLLGGMGLVDFCRGVFRLAEERRARTTPLVLHCTDHRVRQRLEGEGAA